MCATFNYQKTEVQQASMIDNFAPQIAEAFIRSKIESVKATIQTSQSEEEIDEFIDEQLTLIEQMDGFHSLCRCKYAHISSLISSLFDTLFQSYRVGYLYM
jgi:hypothetical protein